MHAGPSPALAVLLRQWPGGYYWSDETDGRHLVLSRPLARRRERWGLHLALFLATLYTIMFAGAVVANGIPYTGLLVFFTSGYPGYPGFLQAWASGVPFAAPLLAILLCHELGHYVVARRYQLDVSPPYFIPVPMFPTFIGTMGAFIRLRTLLSDRRQLFDVGVAGPIAGFLVALPTLAVGLALSHPVAASPGSDGLAVYFGGGPQIPLGDSLITLLLQRLVLGRAAAVSVHPVAFAGWVGMLVTMLNLLPISQLDGGQRPSGRLRRMGGDARYDAEPVADLAARRRAYPVRDAAALAPAHRVRVLVPRDPARPLVVGVVCVGSAGAGVVARTPRSSARARRAAAPARVAPLAGVDGAGAVRGDVRAGAVQNLTVEGGGSCTALHRPSPPCCIA